MKYILHSLFLLLVSLLASCGEDAIITESAESNSSIEGTYTYSLQFDAPYPHYDGEDATRATEAGVWEDGDVVYITFSNGESPAIGKAVYSSSTATWDLSSDMKLVNGRGQSCSVLYSCPEGLESNSLQLDDDNYCTMGTPLSKAFRDENGEYDVIDSHVVIRARLVPVGKRLRFKGGTPGSKIVISGNDLRFICGYNVKDNNIITTGASVELEIGADGYSDYMLLSIGDKCREIRLEFDFGNRISCYYRYFDGNSLIEGESGCFTIPNLSALYGWTIKCQHDYIDLDLPSGLKWATCNVGAEKSDDSGLYFAWGETVGYEQDPSDGHSFDWSNYKWCIGSGNNLTKYSLSSNYGILFDNKSVLDPEDDAASANWGYCWRMPKYEEMLELDNYCDWEVSSYGCRVSSKQNKEKYIYLPAAGYRSNLDFSYESCFYWSATLDTDYNYMHQYRALTLYYSIHGRSDSALPRFYGLNVRPVKR